MKTISTTALSKQLDIPSKELFEILVNRDLICRSNDKWLLTSKGKEFGGQMASSEKFGEFIVWPEDFNPIEIVEERKSEYLNATRIGDEFGISNQRLNNILSEIGWIEKGIKGWVLTSLGRKVGGIQKEHQSGGTYTIWPESILTDAVFLRSVKPSNSAVTEKKSDVFQVQTKPLDKVESSKYPDTLLKTKDGHLVRSRAELIIDNMLYDYGLTHAYERELPVEEKVLSDFYIPSRNGGKAVYIEFWGINDNEKYLERKKIKQELYKKYNLNLIELEDKHIDNLDSYLPKMLLKFNINVD